MGGIVSSVTDAIGLTNVAGEKKAASAAAEASAQSYAMSKEQIALAKETLEFQKEQYADWENVYGPIQENLGAYYKNLTPEKLTTLGLENQQKEFESVQKAIKIDAAQKGITGSGTETAAINENLFKNATARATIRTNAEQTANEQKMTFLGLGLGQGTTMLGQINNASGNVTSAYSNAVSNRTSTSNAYLNSSTQLSMANMQAMSDLVGTGAYLKVKGK